MRSSWRWGVVKVIVLAALAALHTHPAAALDPPPGREIEARMDDLMRQLAICESGGSGNSDRPIHGAGGIHAGRFQFTIRTVVSYVRDRDGHVLSANDALSLAQDYDRAAALAKYMIFERGHFWNWPACSRKLGLARHVTEIKAVAAKRADVLARKGEPAGD